MTVPLRLNSPSRIAADRPYDRTTLVLAALTAWVLLLLMGLVLTF